MSEFGKEAPRWRWPRLLLLAVTVVAGVAAQYWLSIAFTPTWSAAAWLLAVSGFVGLYFLSAGERHFPGSGYADLTPRTEWVCLAAVFVVGAFFVGYRMDEIPDGLNHDAAWEGLYAIRILEGERYTAYAAEAWGRETLTFYFRAVSVWLLGSTPFAVIAPAMLAGLLTLPFFYGWMRSMFGARLAVVATLFLAASGWHLVFSRTGWRSDFQPLFMAATCFFFFKGMQSRGVLEFFFAGLALALTLNTYNAARVFPAVFGLWVLAVALQGWRPLAFVRRYAFGFTWMGLGFAIAILPLAWFAFHHWDAFMGRAVALRGASEFGDALRASLLLFNFSGNGDDFFVKEPALELPAAVLFVFGFLWVLLRLRDARAQFVLIGLLVGTVPGLVSSPNLNRNIGTMIFVFACVGLGAVFFARQLRVLLPRVGRVAAVVLLVGAASAQVVAAFNQYLGDDRRPIWGYYPETTVLGRYMNTLVPDYEIWVGGANFPRDTLTYLTYQGSGNPMRRNYTWVDDLSLLQRLPRQGSGGKGRAIIVPPYGEGRVILDVIARQNPQHEIVDLRFPPGQGPIFARALLVPAP